MQLRTSEIAEYTGGTLTGDGDVLVTGFCTDSREAGPGKMFVPIRGERVDGHRFIPNVFAAGAAATFSETPIEDPAGPVIVVEDSRRALQAVASHYRERFSVPFIGITGSVGKTTTKEMVALALSAGKRVLKTAGNANSQIGLPLTVLRVTEEDEAAVLELGMSMPGEMARIAAVARPTLAIMTNIGVSHIEYLKTRENILKEKLHIADYLPAGAPLFVNGDDDLLSTLESTSEKPVVKFGLSEGCDWRAADLQADVYGTSFTCVHGTERFPVYVPAAGEHMVRNALAALAAAEAVGVPLADAVKAIRSYEPPEMRQRVREIGGITVIDDTYNASPDSMRAALQILGGMQITGKKYAVLADMLELGDYAERGHFETGAFAKEIGADCVIGVGALAKHLVEGFGADGKWFASNAEAAEYLLGKIQPGDTLLVKGSRGMHTEEVIHSLEQKLTEVQ